MSAQERTKSGLLEKRGNWNKAYKQRWFVLNYKKHSLTYAKSKADSEAMNFQGLVDLRRAHVKILGSQDKDYLEDRVFSIETPRRVYIIKAPSKEEAESWRDAIKEASQDPAAQTKREEEKNNANQAYPQNTLQAFFDANSAEATEEELLAQLKANQAVVGEAHPNTAVCLHNLAYFYSKHGQLQKSEQLYTQALKYLIDALGPEHQEVAVCTGNYAVCLKRQGRYREALETFQKALDLAERTWGPNDEKTSDILYNIYANFYAQGLYKEARPYLVRSYEINERGLGPNHPEVLQSAADLRDLDMKIKNQMQGVRPS
jgi:tetratricopeptide (TPR) repeat protein